METVSDKKFLLIPAHTAAGYYSASKVPLTEAGNCIRYKIPPHAHTAAGLIQL